MINVTSSEQLAAFVCGNPHTQGIELDETRSISLAAKFSQPLAYGFSAYAKPGLAYTRTEVEVIGNGSIPALGVNEQGRIDEAKGRVHPNLEVGFDYAFNSSISAGISALWGPLHGGANQEVLEMLEQIQNDGGDVQKWINKAKDKNDPFRLMGFGHRVYKNFDPRAKIIKKACDDVLAKLGVNDPVLEIAKQLEEAALTDSYFVERKLFPNVDFYSGIIYRAMGFPTDFFTVLFSMGRLPGWISQWQEMRKEKQPIARPRQIYTGEAPRAYVHMKDRT